MLIAAPTSILLSAIRNRTLILLMVAMCPAKILTFSDIPSVKGCLVPQFWPVRCKQLGLGISEKALAFPTQKPPALSFPFLILSAWNVDMRLEVEQSYCNHETRLMTMLPTKYSRGEEGNCQYETSVTLLVLVLLFDKTNPLLC